MIIENNVLSMNAAEASFVSVLYSSAMATTVAAGDIAIPTTGARKMYSLKLSWLMQPANITYARSAIAKVIMGAAISLSAPAMYEPRSQKSALGDWSASDMPTIIIERGAVAEERYSGKILISLTASYINMFISGTKKSISASTVAIIVGLSNTFFALMFFMLPVIRYTPNVHTITANTRLNTIRYKSAITFPSVETSIKGTPRNAQFEKVAM